MLDQQDIYTRSSHNALRKFYYIEKEGVFYATYAIFYTTIMYWGMHYYMLGNINKMHSYIHHC